VTFGGTKSIIIPPGAPMLSDPIELTVRPLSDVAVNLYLPAATDLATVHTTGLQTAYVSASGDYTGSAEFPVADRFANRFFLAAVMVDPGMPARAIVAFGDSITDGTASTVNANRRWPDVLARRLKDAGIALAVLNQGIAGNRVLSDGAGVSALARFERDVLSLPAISHVMIRTRGAFDAIIDFDAVIADPAHPAAIASAFDSGDHLHPNDAGYEAMAEAIDLKLFQ
jgi:lysophospholipase L1-like esterase